MHDRDPTSAPANAVTMAKLRFMADLAIETLGELDEEVLERRDGTFRIVPETATEEMLRTVLRFAIPVLEAAGHWELASEVRGVLRGER